MVQSSISEHIEPVSRMALKEGEKSSNQDGVQLKETQVQSRTVTWENVDKTFPSLVYLDVLMCFPPSSLYLHKN